MLGSCGDEIGHTCRAKLARFLCTSLLGAWCRFFSIRPIGIHISLVKFPSSWRFNDSGANTKIEGEVVTAPQRGK